jgi:hypothetical protein
MVQPPFRDRPDGERELDFIVIGAQKAGTTSLWQYLRWHPEIAMPHHKEAPIFCAGEDEYRRLLRWFMETNFGDLPGEQRLGKVAAHYMMGLDSVDVEQIAERIATSLPRVRLVALLRDPISRAISQYRMSVRRGFESRAFSAAVEELLEPAAQEIGRARPTETNSYLAQGEYGRILQAYTRRFPPAQIHVEWTASLDSDPGGVVDRVLALLGLRPGFRPEGLGARHHRGGTRPLLSDRAEGELREFLEASVWPRVGGEVAQVRRTFEFFMQTWNVSPDENLPELPTELRTRLRSHYRRDAERLPLGSGPPPWLAEWQAAEAGAER